MRHLMLVNVKLEKYDEGVVCIYNKDARARLDPSEKYQCAGSLLENKIILCIIS